MFGIFSRTPTQAPTPPTNNPPANPGPSNNNPPNNPTGQQQQQQQQQNNPPPVQPTPPNNTPPAPPTPSVRLSELLAPSETPRDPVDFASRALDILMDSSSQPDTSDTPLRINEDALMTALQNIDLTGGADLANLLNLQNDPEAFSNGLRDIMQRTQMNTIQTMVSLINPMVQQAMQQTRDHAVTQSRNNVTVDSVVTAFEHTHSYSKNPVISRMVNGMASALVKTAPPGTSVQQMVDALHTTLTGMTSGINTGPNENGPNIPRGAQTDFSNTFSSR